MCLHPGVGSAPPAPHPLPSGYASLSEDDISREGGDAQVLTPPTSVCMCVCV